MLFYSNTQLKYYTHGNIIPRCFMRVYQIRTLMGDINFFQLILLLGKSYI